MDPNQNQGTPPQNNVNQPVSPPLPVVNNLPNSENPVQNTSLPQSEHGTSKTRNIIAILLLVFFYFIGVIYVFLFTKWPKWAKIVILLPIPLTILLIIGSIALMSKDPAGSFKQANNALRASDVNLIVNAIGTYAAENENQLPSGITNVSQEISSTGANICGDLVSTYIASLPVDPSLEDQIYVSDCKSSYSTGYYVVKNEDGTITVSAPMTEGELEVSVTR